MQSFFLSFLTVASIQFLAVVSPGPDFAIVAKNALLYPRRQAIYTALGITLGLSIHITYCLFGIALVVAHSTFVFNLLKYAGAAYLIYIGIRSFFDKTLPTQSSDGTTKNVAVISVSQAIRQGFFCNLLNPKAGLFFIGLFTLVIKPGTPLWQQSIYAVWMLLVTFVWFSSVAYFMTHPDFRRTLLRIQPIAVKSLGVLLIVLGVALLFVSL